MAAEFAVRVVICALVYFVGLYAYGKRLLREERARVNRIRAEIDLIKEVHKMRQANIPVPEHLEKEIEEMCGTRTSGAECGRKRRRRGCTSCSRA